MDWSKVDAALAGALSDAVAGGERDGAGAIGRRLPVFVHVLAAQADAVLLAELEVGGAPAASVRTGTLTPAAVGQLTDQPWVMRVQLSGPLRLRGDS